MSGYLKRGSSTWGSAATTGWTKTNMEAVLHKEDEPLCFQRKLGSFSVCRKWWRFAINQLWRVQCTFLWSAGGAASETDWLNRSGTPALWLVANQTQMWQLWWRGGHRTHCYPSRIMPTTFCTARRTCCGAHSLTRRFRKPFIHAKTLCNETHLLSNFNIL